MLICIYINISVKITLVIYKKEAIKMATLMTSKTKKKTGLNDEFEKYLDKQRGYTTFNGIEVARFSSYKKLLGLK
ncbi:MAG TPA: hypothetical protein DDW90_06725 [Cyanobacteria bacterium UBA9971]|nr:hypothetical protein [Cyanobacteria bacterium UBA9971]